MSLNFFKEISNQMFVWKLVNILHIVALLPQRIKLRLAHPAWDRALYNSNFKFGLYGGARMNERRYDSPKSRLLNVFSLTLHFFRPYERKIASLFVSLSLSFSLSVCIIMCDSSKPIKVPAGVEFTLGLFLLASSTSLDYDIWPRTSVFL